MTTALVRRKRRGVARRTAGRVATVARSAGRSVARQNKSLKARLARSSAKSEEFVGGLVRTGEISAAAFFFGGLQGYYYDKTGAKDAHGLHVGPVPVDLAAAALLKGLALARVAGKNSHHLSNFGDGALAAHLAQMGRGVGFKMAQEKKGSTTGALDDDISDLLS